MIQRATCDLKKVQWARLAWHSQEGVVKAKEPDGPTVHGIAFDPNAKVRSGFGETMLSYATRHELLDVWTPVVRLQFASNHQLRYCGNLALKIWEAWNAMIFSKTKKKGKQ